MLQDDETGPLHQWSHVLFSLAFESGSRMNLHASPLRAGFVVVVVVVLCWSLVFLDIFPTGFQSHLSCARSKGWGVWCGDWVPGSQGKIEYAFGILLIVDQHGWNGFSLFPGENISGFFLFVFISRCCPFIPCYGGCSSRFQVPWEGIIPYADVLRLWEGWVQDLSVLSPWTLPSLCCFNFKPLHLVGGCYTNIFGYLKVGWYHNKTKRCGLGPGW